MRWSEAFAAAASQWPWSTERQLTMTCGVSTHDTFIAQSERSPHNTRADSVWGAHTGHRRKAQVGRARCAQHA
jgi:hypothetical protein